MGIFRSTTQARYLTAETNLFEQHVTFQAARNDLSNKQKSRRSLANLRATPHSLNKFAL